MNPFAGKRLSYRIGAASAGEGADDVVIMSPYDNPPAKKGIPAGYCNLLDERESYDADSNTGDYGPYLDPTDTAEQYREGVIDPSGSGFINNLTEQFKLRKAQGFEYVELDNPDAYEIADVIRALDYAELYGLKVIAKNPLEMDGRPAARSYLAHPNVYAAIVERGCGTPRDMDDLRRTAGKPDLTIWFVAFGSGQNWGNDTAKRARNYKEMYVTFSAKGEYENSIDVL